MREWLVAGALIESDGRLLLVRNRRRGGGTDWSTPGGVIDAGEAVTEGLAREVREETGLAVTAWEGPVYAVEAVARHLGWHLRVEVYRALRFSGELAVCDPDGIVVDARFVPLLECAAHLEGCHLWVREPLVAWIDGTCRGAGAVFRYEITPSGVRRVP